MTSSGRTSLLLHQRVAEFDPDGAGEFSRLFQLGLVDHLAQQQNFFQRSCPIVSFVLAAESGVILALSPGIGQAEHRLGKLVEQILRLLGEFAGRELADVRVHLAIVLADLADVVFELLEPQDLIVIQRARGLLDAEPLAINVQGWGHDRSVCV